MLFKIGQKVTLKEKIEDLVHIHNREPDPRIQFGKVYTVLEYDPKPWKGFLFISFEEVDRRYSYPQDYFAPVVSDTVLAEELSEIFSLEVRK